MIIVKFFVSFRWFLCISPRCHQKVTNVTLLTVILFYFSFSWSSSQCRFFWVWNLAHRNIPLSCWNVHQSTIFLFVFAQWLFYATFRLSKISKHFLSQKMLFCGKLTCLRTVGFFLNKFLYVFAQAEYQSLHPICYIRFSRHRKIHWDIQNTNIFTLH